MQSVDRERILTIDAEVASSNRVVSVYSDENERDTF